MWFQRTCEHGIVVVSPFPDLIVCSKVEVVIWEIIVWNDVKVCGMAKNERGFMLNSALPFPCRLTTEARNSVCSIFLQFVIEEVYVFCSYVSLDCSTLYNKVIAY